MSKDIESTMTATGTESLNDELESLCNHIQRILCVKHGSIEIHCYRGKAKEVHVHDKSCRTYKRFRLKL